MWASAVQIGARLIWLQTYAERLRDPNDDRGATLPAVAGLEWITPITRMPQKPGNVAHDPSTQTLSLGDGTLAGVREDVWDYSISGMQVVKRWISYRTAGGAGRAANSSNPLDRIRPVTWASAWNDELLELISVVTHTVEAQPRQAALLDAICDGPLISASELPTPELEQRSPP
jgi:hypothetical protein